jgi:phosphatidylinositol N-acetylglucosaminyltransferase subunit C
MERLLTFALVIGAGDDIGLTLRDGWTFAIVGSFLGSILTAFAMGGCSWCQVVDQPSKV